MVLVKISSTVLNGQGRILRDRYKGRVKSVRGRKYETVYAAEHLRTWITFSEEDELVKEEKK